MDIGRNLTLTSLQGSDRFDSKQSNVSGGVSYVIIGSGSSAWMSVSQAKIKSKFDSVREQTGLFAGKDGYQVTVGEHTQLNGSVLASTSSADKNKLDTGTLGWSDIRNKADFSSQHQSVSGSSGGDVASLFQGNMGSLLLVGANNKGHDSSTTYAAVSDGQITVRDQDKQQQDVATLSRDVEHANNALSPIFDKEKEQKRLRQAQLIGDIGNQAMDIIRTQGTIEAAKAAVAELTEEQRNMPGASRDASVKDRAAYVAMLQQTDAYRKVMADYGTGSDLQRAAQAVTAAIQGLAGGNLGQALVGASAPYLAGVIKDSTGDNLEARIMAHAVLGAVLAKSQQSSALAGAAGAGIGELVASQLYPGKAVDQLTEAEKQRVSALSTLAGGLVGGLVGGDSSSAVAGAISAKNATENNNLKETESLEFDKEMIACKAAGGDCFDVVMEYLNKSKKNSSELSDKCSSGGVVCVSYEEVLRAATNVALDEDAQQFRTGDKLKDQDVIALVKYLNGKDLEMLSSNISTTDRVVAVVIDPTSWPMIFMGGKALITGAGSKEMVIAAGVSGSASAVISYGVSGDVKLSDVIGSTLVGAITAGKGYNPTVTWNTVGGYYSAEIKGDDPFLGGIVSKAGASMGFAVGSQIKVPFEKALNPVSKQYEWVPTGIWTITQPAPVSTLPSVIGNIGGSVTSGVSSSEFDKQLKKDIGEK